MAGAGVGVLKMQLTVQIDDVLLQEAVRLSGQQTPQTLLLEALREYIQQRKRLAVLQEFGQYDFDPAYDYKKERKIR